MTLWDDGYDFALISYMECKEACRPISITRSATAGVLTENHQRRVRDTIAVMPQTLQDLLHPTATVVSRHYLEKLEEIARAGKEFFDHHVAAIGGDAYAAAQVKNLAVKLGQKLAELEAVHKHVQPASGQSTHAAP